RLFVVRPCLGWGEKSVSLDEPRAVVASGPGEEREPQLLDGLEGTEPEELLLEGSDEPLGAPVALRGTHESRARLDAEEEELVLKSVARVLAPVVVPHREALGDAEADDPESRAYGLADGLQGLVAGAGLRGVDAHALRGAMVHRDEDGHLAILLGESRRRIRAPHLVWLLRDDGPVVVVWPEYATCTRRGQEIRLAHEAENSSEGGPDTFQVPQPRPDLPVALTDPLGSGQVFADEGEQLFVRPERLGSALTEHWPLLILHSVPVQRRPAHPPGPAHARQAIGLLRGRRDGLAHGLDFLHGKCGALTSSFSAFSRSSSTSIVSSPTFARSRRFSSSATLGSRLFSPASALARKAFRHSDSVAAVAPSSRETVSRSSPLSNRITASTFRRAVKRPRSS